MADVIRDCIEKDEHHDICSENKAVLKEYVCLKLKPITTVQENQGFALLSLKSWLTWITIFLIGGGLTSGLISYAQNIEQGKIAEELIHSEKERIAIRVEMKDIRNDMVARVDKLEHSQTKQLDDLKKDILRAMGK